MDDVEHRIRKRLRDDFAHYASKCLKLRSKDGSIHAFNLNKVQLHIHKIIEQQYAETKKVRVLILKGRQVGCSTYVEGRYYWKVTHRFGVRAFILTHDNDATNNLFDMVQRYHQHCPIYVRPSIEASNSKELIFSGLDSGYKLGTAGNKSVGRSSTIQLLHGSEVAYWPNASDHAKGIFQAVPDEHDTEIILESTANGTGNYFHQIWLKALAKESDFIPIFIPWYWEDGYRRPLNIDDKFEITEEEHKLISLYSLSLEQLNWRRSKINDFAQKGHDGLKAFYQEYPMSAAQAFQMSGEDNFIAPDMVAKARITKVEKYGKLLIGVDPARFGKDKTTIIRRIGRCAFGLQKYVKIDGMEVAGLIHNVILNENPHFVFIDTIGMGGPIYDRLIELGHRKKLVAVNVALVAINEKRYANKRAELWGLMREWIYAQDCEIPDDDELHADLCAPEAKRPDSNGRLKIESKEDMRSRGVNSPDCADALAHTFALPDAALLQDSETDHNAIAERIMRHTNTVNRLRKSAYVG